MCRVVKTSLSLSLLSILLLAMHGANASSISHSKPSGAATLQLSTPGRKLQAPAGLLAEGDHNGGAGITAAATAPATAAAAATAAGVTADLMQQATKTGGRQRYGAHRQRVLASTSTRVPPRPPQCTNPPKHRKPPAKARPPPPPSPASQPQPQPSPQPASTRSPPPSCPKPPSPRTPSPLPPTSPPPPPPPPPLPHPCPSPPPKRPPPPPPLPSSPPVRPASLPPPPPPPSTTTPPPPLGDPYHPPVWDLLPTSYTPDPSFNLPKLADNYVVSPLFGQAGEAWVPHDRLPDWSYAGYAGNAAAIPAVPTVVDMVAQYGAVGDGRTDNTRAFLAALADVTAGAIYVPPGKYVINTQLIIDKPGVVLRGAGMGYTTLLLNRSLTELYGQTWQGGAQTSQDREVHSDWKNGPGLIRFEGPSWDSTSVKLADVTAKAQRGERTLKLSSVQDIQPGSLVTLVMSDVEGMLHTDMNFRTARQGCQYTCWTTPRAFRFHSRVIEVYPGKRTVTLERVLPVNVSAVWLPELWTYTPGLTQVGIEDLTIEHRWTPYPEHLGEEGWNGLEFNSAANCWARNVAIVNGDISLSVHLSSFCTFENIQVSRTRARASGNECHYGIQVTGSQDVLVKDWSIGMRCFHDACVFNWTLGVAFVNGSGYDLAMDHHRLYPFATLWSNIAVGLGTRAWSGGGITPWGTGSSAYPTFWNVRANRVITRALPVWDLGHRAAFVAVAMGDAVDAAWNRGAATQQGWVRQDLPGLPTPSKQIWPPDLLSAQLAWRQRMGGVL